MRDCKLRNEKFLTLTWLQESAWWNHWCHFVLHINTLTWIANEVPCGDILVQVESFHRRGVTTIRGGVACGLLSTYWSNLHISHYSFNCHHHPKLCSYVCNDFFPLPTKDLNGSLKRNCLTQIYKYTIIQCTNTKILKYNNTKKCMRSVLNF